MHSRTVLTGVEEKSVTVSSLGNVRDRRRVRRWQHSFSLSLHPRRQIASDFSLIADALKVVKFGGYEVVQS